MSTERKAAESPKYPRGERVWRRYLDASGALRFLLTSKENSREAYFLYEYADGVFKRLGRAASPKDLEEKYGVDAKIRKGDPG